MPSPFYGLLRQLRRASPGQPAHDVELEDLAPPEGTSAPAALLPAACLKKVKGQSVAVVGGGFGGLMAARVLAQHGLKVTVFEARDEVGGRVLSDTTFSKGRITEAGAELIGTFHHRWRRLAIELGLAWINRMDHQQYRQEGLNLKLRLDKPLSMLEIKALAIEMKQRVLIPISRDAAKIASPSQPWLDPALQPFDQMSVATALETRHGIRKATHLRLWMAVELLLVNDNVAPLEKMNYLGLLCLVKGGQLNAHDNPPMGYWDELELFRCADGCQTLALRLADQIRVKHAGMVIRQAAVTRIDLSDRVHIEWQQVLRNGRQVVPGTPGKRSFDHVVLAVPPSVWPDIKITPTHPQDAGQVGLMGMGPAVKYISDVKERFWIKNGAAPSGGSLPLGQVWEGTDNQTRVGDQGILLSVYSGGRIPAKSRFEPELEALYPGYKKNLTKTALFANWPAEPFIKTGLTAPGLGDIFSVGRKLNEPFMGRMVFAGEHTRMDLFGYMEGALASGERAAETLLLQACGLWKTPTAPTSPSRPTVRVAEVEPELAGEADSDDETFEDEVFGTDDRVLVKDTLARPFRWVCAIDVLVANPESGKGGPKFISKSRATGVLIGPRHVLTAAHILDKQPMQIDGETRKVKVEGLLVSPARNGDNQNNPFGKVASKTIEVSKPYRIMRTVTQDGKQIEIPIQKHDDYALIVLDKDLASSTHSKMSGSLGYWGHAPDKAQLRRLDPATLNGMRIVVNGYPGDRCGRDKITGSAGDKKRKIEYCVQRRPDEWASTQWTSRGTAQVDAASTDLFHAADTYQGQSGAPICVETNGKLVLAAIHTGVDGARNQGVRVTRRMLGELCAWINADAGRTIATIENDSLVVQANVTTAPEVT